jgi:hypothetical protein
MNLTDIAFHRDNPIYARDIKAYKRDSRRALNESKRRRGKWVNSFLNCISLYTPLLALALPLSHCLYA